MANKNDKISVFSKLTALKVDSSSLGKVDDNAYSGIITDSDNPVDFILDLFKTVGDFEDIKDIIMDAIYKKLPELNGLIKTNLITVINGIVYANLGTKVEDKYLLSNNSPIRMPIKSCDLRTVLKTPPTSNEGRLLYFDVDKGMESEDIQTFIYNAIQQQRVWHNWKDILHIQTIDEDIKFAIDDSYKDKTLSEYFEDLINSIEFMDSRTLLNSLIDSYSGTISSNSNLSKKDLEMNSLVDRLINKIYDLDDPTNVTTKCNVFDLDESDLLAIEKNVNKLSNGAFDINNSYGSFEQIISMDSLTKVNEEIEKSPAEIETIISDALNSLGTIDTNKVSEADKETANLNFLENIIKNLAQAFINILLSPRVTIVFNLANAVMGREISSDQEAFIKDNINIMGILIDSIKNMIISIIMDKCIKLIKEIVAKKLMAILNEKAKYAKMQIKSLTGF